jgi:hypothetical protein
MTHNRTRRRLGHPFDLPTRWRWLVWPALALSGAAAAVALWLEEGAITVARDACAPLAILSGMAVLLFWFNHLVFKAAKPRREDLNNHNHTKG